MTDDLGVHRTADRDRWIEEVRTKWTDEAPRPNDVEPQVVVNEYRDAGRILLYEEVTRAMFMLKAVQAQIGAIPAEIEALLRMLLLRRDEISRIIATFLDDLMNPGLEE